MTLTHIAERLAVDLSLPVDDKRLWQRGFKLNPQFRMIRPSGLLILPQSKLNEVINKNRTENKWGQKCNQIMSFDFH